MAEIRPSFEMKDSGIEWIGSCPFSWEVVPLYVSLREINQKNSPIVTTNILSLTNTEGVIPYSERGNQGNKSKDNYEEYKVVYPDTIVANSMNILIGSVGLSVYEGCVSPVYYVYAAKPNNDIRYLNYLFQMELFQKRLRQFANGILEIRLRIASHDILHQKVMMPSFLEQQAIADYLDDRCSKIDEIIVEAAASIEEYKKLKQTVITEAVTHGIHYSAKKYSGFSWIGDIPIHWKTGQLKRFASIKSGITLGKKYENPRDLIEVPYLRVANVQSEYIDLSDVTSIKVLPSELEKYRLHAGELLMTEGGDRDKLGRGCIWNGEIDPCIHQNHVFALTVNNSDLFVEYLDFVTTSNVGRDYFDLTAKKTTNLASTNSTTIMTFHIPVPPLNEQKDIVVYLNSRVVSINSLISEKQSLIEDLQAYKKSLIYETVTGKRRVV